MKRFVFVFLGLLAVVGFAADFQTGDRVELVAANTLGVPVRDQPGDTKYYRWPDGTEASVVSTQGNAVQVEAAGKRGWILAKYLTSLTSPVEEGGEVQTVMVGAWNLEHFHDGEPRGFPELMGNKALPTRTPDDYAKIASAIRDRLGVGVLMLSEIAGVPGQKTSNELERLKTLLGPSWKYAIGSSGGLNGAQRVAILFDESKVEALLIDELVIPKQLVTGDDIFNRDPLVGYFRVRRSGGAPANDFVVVALHLASGQDKVENHNEAMARFRTELHALFQSRPDLQSEKDVIVGGDLNASMYDNKKENFWDGFDSSGFKFTTLAPPDVDDYPPSRLKGDPPFPGSRIDYLFASEHIIGSLTLPTAFVHHELVPNGDFLLFRRNYSDHFPVTVTVMVADDND